MPGGRINRNHGIKPPRYVHQVKDHKRLWEIWNGIKKRCLFENDQRYHQYGGRGILMCDEWQSSFDHFADWALSNGYEDGLSIERIDVNGNYCPENCKWIPLREQAFNKRDTIWIHYHGERIQLKKICIMKGLNYDAINNRIVALGWDPEQAIDIPIATNEGSLRSECIKCGLNYGTVHDRIFKLGWTREEALSVETGRGRHSAVPVHASATGKCCLCGKEFTKTNGIQKFCSASCRESAKKERRHEKHIK